MNILITGAFGNIGLNTLEYLLEMHENIIVFDLPTKKNLRQCKRLQKTHVFSVIWGSITNQSDVRRAVQNINCVVHLAAIIPNLSEIHFNLAKNVNISGTQNLIDALECVNPHARFIFASSVTVHGPTMHLNPPITLDTQLNPKNNYAYTKIEAEKIIKKSSLEWLICRFTATPMINLSFGAQKDTISHSFEIPMAQRIEFLHPNDAGLALANATQLHFYNKILLIGGGEQCQMLGKEFFSKTLHATGLDEFPESAFISPQTKDDWYTLDWLDTHESEELLHYQNHKFSDYLIDIKKKLGIKRWFIRLFKHVIQRFLLKYSPYYKKNILNLNKFLPVPEISLIPEITLVPET